MQSPTPIDPGPRLLGRDLSTERARLRLSGPDARRFLHGMVSNDIKGLQPGQGCHAALLTVKGKLLADLVVYDCGDFGLLIELVATARASVQSALDKHLIMDDAAIADISQSVGELGVYGSAAAEFLGPALGSSPSEVAALPKYHGVLRGSAEVPLFCAATTELGIPGFHVIGAPSELAALAERLAAAGGTTLTAEAAEVMRVEAGTPFYGIDLDEDRMPAEAGLDDAVSFSKGCYLGQEVVVRLRDRGHLNRKLCGLRLPDGGAPPVAGTRLGHASRPLAGIITSAVSSPRYGTIALAYIHRSVWEPGTELELIAPQAPPPAEPNEQRLGRTAIVVPLPFAPPAAHSP